MTGAASPSAVDVVVVGGGGAGLAAAVEAADAGASVVLLEKNDKLGGTTARSIGSMSANRTSLQRKAGVEDTADSHFHDMALFAGDYVDRDNLALRRLYVEKCGETLEWLRSLGIVFFGPTPEPPHSQPRMHNVLPNSAAYSHHLAKAARRRGVTILTGTRALKLLMHDGGVAGVQVAGPDGVYDITARGGVVLGAGDFSSSRDLKAEYIDSLASTVPGINPTSTGDGIRLGIEAGGQVLNADLALGPELRFGAPSGKLLVQRIPPIRLLSWSMKIAIAWMPDWLMRPFVMAFATTYLAPSARLFADGAVLVDATGQRFTDETATPWLELPKRHDGQGFILFDDRLAKRLSKWPNYISTAPGVAYAFLPDYRRNRKDIFHRADTVDGLARSMSVPVDALRRTIAAVGEERRAEGGWRAPYVALGPLQSWIVLTEGGLAVDPSLRVLDNGGQPIGGLYAAGSNGQGGLLLEGHGNHVGWAFVSGRVAGKHAAARSKSQRAG